MRKLGLSRVRLLGIVAGPYKVLAGVAETCISTACAHCLGDAAVSCGGIIE